MSMPFHIVRPLPSSTTARCTVGSWLKKLFRKYASGFGCSDMSNTPWFHPFTGQPMLSPR